MTDIITRICIEKWRHIERRKAAMPIADVRRAAAAAPPPRGFAAALDAKVERDGYGLIAEIKKASPSKGLIRDDFDPPSLARAYQAGGAACLSVLTDTPYFQGADEFLTQARDAVSLPVLRKDFMLDPYQVFEARALGADCILLIMAALQENEAHDLEAQARELGMDVLIEVHNAPELERAMALDSSLIGINNRSLRTMQVDMATTELLCPMVPRGRRVVCESGLRSPADLHRMGEAGAKRFLVGESLMAQKDVEQATRTLLGID